MKESLRNRMRVITQRLDKLEKGGIVVCVIQEDDDAETAEARAKAECPRCEIMIMRIVYE